jgi:hypothetical protein
MTGSACAVADPPTGGRPRPGVTTSSGKAGMSPASSTAATPNAALVAGLTRRWAEANRAYHDHWPNAVCGLGQIMLVAAKVKPAACSLCHHGGWDGLPGRKLRELLIGSGFIVRSRHGLESGATAIVAGSSARADELEMALSMWRAERDRPGARVASSTRLGRALGYPASAIAAFASYPAGPGLLDDDLPPWVLDEATAAWWSALHCFRPAADAAGQAAARSWLEGAVLRFHRTFPAAPAPVSDWKFG